MTTTMDNEEPDLTVTDAKEYLRTEGLKNFEERLATRRERLGQAWFNSLPVDDQDKLRGSLYDPFHKTKWADILKALRFLLEN